MSLATLKKKTKAIFNNPHIGDKYGKYSKLSAVRMNAYNNTNGATVDLPAPVAPVIYNTL